MTAETIGSVLKSSEAWLARRGVDQPRVDAGSLLAAALGMERLQLYLETDRPLQETELARFRPLLAARGRRQPLAQILEKKGFWTLELKVNDQVLTPRADTETLVEWALEIEAPDNARVIDLCTGSGCIIAALASERPDWQLAATELSPSALTLARENLDTLGFMARVQLEEGDLFAGLDGPFDLIVANPPYVAESEASQLDPEVRQYEPELALFATGGGLDVLRRIAQESPARSTAGTWLLMEHGHEQGAAVRGLLDEAGFKEIDTRRDLGQRERVSGGRYP